MYARSLALLISLLPSYVSAFDLSLFGADALCGNNNGYVRAVPFGGIAPYTFLWNTGAETDSIGGLPPGIYSVTVMDSYLQEATGQFTVQNAVTPSMNYMWTTLGLNSCHGLCNQGLWIDPLMFPLNMVQPFTFSPPLEPLTLPGSTAIGAYTGLCPGAMISFTATDATGCTMQVLDLVGYGSSDPSPMAIVSVLGTCSGMSFGSVTVNLGVEVNGTYTPMWQSRILNSTMQPIPGGQLSGYPLIGYNIVSKTNLASGTYYVERRFYHEQGDCVDLLPFTIPDLGPDCGVVTGTAFIDINTNCINNSETTVPQGIVIVEPGPHYAALATNGSYSISLSPGTYTLTQQSASVQEHCTGAPIPFDITAGLVTNLPLPDTSIVELDLETVIGSGPARPGFAFECGVTVRNLTPTSSGNTSLTLTFDPLLIYLNASPSPSSVVGNTLTWDESQLTAWQKRSYTINFTVPPDPLLIGTELVTTSTVSSVALDGDQSNNTAANSRIITGSYDPNDKLAQTSMGSSSIWVIDQDEWVDYTIRFQNTGTDTAFNILITDTLTDLLDPSTIQMGAGSHAFTWELRDQGTLKFYFQNILLPDSNYSEPLSHGFVGFRIRPHLPILPGTTIDNIANIFFDFNPPVITEPSVLVATISTGVEEEKHAYLRIFPNPSTETITVEGMLFDRIRLIGIDGRVLRDEFAHRTPCILDVQYLAPGIYVIEVHTGMGRSGTTRFIKH